MWVFTVTSTGQAPAPAAEGGEGKGGTSGATTRDPKLKAVLAQLTRASYPVHNSQVLTARCFCPGRFCIASGIPSEQLSLAFSPVGADNTSPPQTTSSRKGTDTRV